MAQLGIFNRQILVLIGAFLIASCASTTKHEFNTTCGPTPVMESDLRPLGLDPQPGQVVVVHIFASWCPFCRTDLARIAERYRQKRWDPAQTKVFLIAYKNHSENATTFAQFMQKDLPALGFPPGAVKAVYIDEAYPELSARKNAHGDLLFEGWKGIPFGLVFGKDQRLAFRGHFTMTDISEDRHYNFIADTQGETCH